MAMFCSTETPNNSGSCPNGIRETARQHHTTPRNAREDTALEAHLLHEAHLIPQALEAPAAHGHVVNEHLALQRVVEALQQSHDGALAAARRPNQRHRLARLDHQVEVAQHRHVGPRWVGEGAVTELDLAADLALVALRLLDVHRRDPVDDLVQLRRRRLRRRKRREGGADVSEGESAEQNRDKGLDHLAAREAACLAIVDGAFRVVLPGHDDELGAGVGRDPVHSVEGEEHQADAGADGQPLADAGRLSVGEKSVVALDLVPLARVRGNDAHAGEHLVGHIPSPGVSLLRLGFHLGYADNQDHERHGEERSTSHDDKRQLPRCREADDDAAEQSTY
mmetsp:Transcript_16829/g.45979  ORF Transcript_16829/g.45979 Transcript_16829/m.45979 type:complete len:337 (+) Transcript_16829:638-1648(+)